MLTRHNHQADLRSVISYLHQECRNALIKIIIRSRKKVSDETHLMREATMWEYTLWFVVVITTMFRNAVHWLQHPVDDNLSSDRRCCIITKPSDIMIELQDEPWYCAPLWHVIQQWSQNFSLSYHKNRQNNNWTQWSKIRKYDIIIHHFSHQPKQWFVINYVLSR